MAGVPNVLLVDSDADDVRMVREVVESAGLDLHVSSDRESAVDAIRSFHPDLVLIRPQTREIGVEDVAAELRKADPAKAAPIVLIQEGAPPGWASADSGAPPRQIFKPLGAPALLSLLAHYFPSAFLPPAQADGKESEIGASAHLVSFTARGAHDEGADAAGDRLSAESFEDGPLGDLLDMVFPVGDSGDLAAALAEGTLFGAGADSAPANAVDRSSKPPEPSPTEGRRPPAAVKGVEPTWPPIHSVPVSAPPVAPPRAVRPEDPKSAAPEAPPPLMFRNEPPKSVPLAVLPPYAGLSDSTKNPAPVTPQPHPFRTEPPKSVPLAVLPPATVRTEPPRSVPVAALPPHAGREGPTPPVGRGDFLPVGVAEPARTVAVLPIQPPADAVNPAQEAHARAEHRAPSANARMRPARRLRAARARRWMIIAALAAAAAAAATLAVTRWIAGRESDLKPYERGARRERPSAASHPDAVEAAPPSTTPDIAVTTEVPLLPEERSTPGGSHGSPIAASTGPQIGRRVVAVGEVQGARGESTRAVARSAAPEIRAESSVQLALPASTEAPEDPDRPLGSEAPVGAGVQADPARESAGPDGSSAADVKPADAESVDVKAAGARPADPDPSSVVVAPSAARGTEPQDTPPEAAAADKGNHQAPPPAEPTLDRSPSPRNAAQPSEPAAPPVSDLALLAPVPLSRPQPRYPPSARASKVAGSVRLLVRVAEDGSVTIARVVGSIAPALDEAAVRSVLEWKYRPAQFGDRTVSAWVEESVAFNP